MFEICFYIRFNLLGKHSIFKWILKTCLYLIFMWNNYNAPHSWKLHINQVAAVFECWLDWIPLCSAQIFYPHFLINDGPQKWWIINRNNDKLLLIVLGHILCQILLYCTLQGCKCTFRHLMDRFATCEKKISKQKVPSIIISNLWKDALHGAWYMQHYCIEELKGEDRFY